MGNSIDASQRVGIDALIQQAHGRYTAANPKSLSQYKTARKVLPGANTRTVLHYDPFPVTIVKGQGAKIWDVDDHVYTDFLGEYTAGLYGHSNKAICNAIKSALDSGITLGGPSLVESKLAKLICDRFPAVERIRFCNSGTEANILNISAARAITGKTDVLVVEGSYHGSVLTFVGDSPMNLPFPIHRMTYNDTESAVDLIHRLASNLATVLVEPMIGAGGAIPATREFLSGLRDATQETGALLIFDEVMTSRITAGGLHGFHGIKPDLVTFGKYLGGGLTFGAFGGSADILERFDPSRKAAWPHAGTFNNNILTMTAGYTGLNEVFTAEVANAFFDSGNNFRQTLSSAVAELELPVQITGLGSIMAFHFSETPPTAPINPAQTSSKLYELIHIDMMLRGQYFARRGMINLSLPMTDETFANFQSDFVAVLKARASTIRDLFESG